jgi:hypothetical protein
MAAFLLAIVLLMTPLAAVAQPDAIGWPEAVANLAAERTRAVACAGRARTLDADTAARLGAGYAEAKAEVDAVVAGLSVALAQGGQPQSLPDLERRITAGAEGRERFCRAVIERAPLTPGERGVLADVLGAFVKPLVEAVVAIWKQSADDNRLRRDTIRAQLEATRWPAFADIPPAL